GLVRGEGGAERDDLRALLVVHARDDVVDRLVALREALLREDVPAELLVADAERLAHVFEVPQGVVRDDDARFPVALDRILGHRCALVLCRVAKLKASFPSAPERRGPISSVPMPRPIVSFFLSSPGLP